MQYFHDRYWKKKKSPTEDYVYKVNLVKRLVLLKKNLRVLDFGCGKGDITKAIASVNPSLQITGVDVSEVAVQTARKTSSGKFYTIKEGEKLPFKNNSFDFVTAFDVLVCVYDTELIFKELSRVLKPKGVLVITEPCYSLLKNIIIAFVGFEQVFNPRGPVIRFYTKKSLIREIRAVGLSPLTFGYFGRFYPFPRGMYVICKK